MAKVEGIAKVKVDGQEAGKQLEILEAKAKDLRRSIINVQKADILDNKKLKDLKSQLKGINNEMKQVKNTTFTYQKTLNNLSGASITELNKAYRKLNLEVKKLDRNTTEYKTKAANLKAIKGELAKVRLDMAATGSSSKRMFSKIADGFNKYGTMLLGLGASLMGVVFSVRKAIDVFNEFEAAESNLSALTKLSGDDLDYLSQSAKDMSTSFTEDGVRITKSATDIENAFTTVGSQRPELLKVKENLKAVTEDALILAEASKGELAPSVMMVTSALNNFDLAANQSRKVINTVAAGSQAGAAPVAYLTKVFDKAGTTANLLKLKVEDLVGITEAVAPKFNDASRAGNSLDKVLMKMKDQQIGYVDGMFDINAALDEVRAKTEKGITVSSMFGVEHAKMVEVLLAEQDQINYYTEAVTGSNVAVEQAITNTSNNAAALEQAKNKAQANAMVLGKELAPALTFSTNAFSYMLKVLVTIIKNWDTFIKYLKVSIVTIGTYIAVTKGAAIVQNLYSKAVKIATAIQKAFNTTMKASPWGIIAGLIAGAAAALILFKDEIKEGNKAIREFNTNLAKEKGELNNVFDALEQTKEGTDARKELINKVNKLYGKYLPNLLTEKSTLDEIAVAQDLATKALENNLAVKAQQAAIDEVINKNIEKRTDITNDIIEIATKNNANLSKLKADELNELIKFADANKKYTQKGIEDSFQFSEAAIKKMNAFYKANIKENLSFVAETSQLGFRQDIEKILLAEKKKNEELLRIKASFGSYIVETEKETGKKVSDTKKKQTQEEIEEEKRKAEEEKRLREEAWKERVKANESMKELISSMNLKLITDARQKAEQEVQIWYDKEKKKIEVSKASAKLKAQAVEALEKVHTKKLLDIDKKYNDETLKVFENVKTFLEKQQLSLETDRDAIIQRDIEKIKVKYDTQLAIIEEELKKENKDYDKFLTQKNELEKLKKEEIKAYKLEKEQEFADQVLAVREQYGLVSQEEKLTEELAALDENLANKLLSNEEYEQAKATIEEKYRNAKLKKQRDAFKKELDLRKKGIQDAQAVISALGNFISAAKETELQEAGDNEEAKKEIMKKYADKEFAVKAAQIVASTALSIMQAFAQLGPVAGAIAAALIGVTGVIQLSNANAERERVKGLAEGGGIPVVREQDGKHFNAVYGGNKSGLFKRPTALVAEEGPEYVIPYSGLQNPEIRSFVGAIESSRQAGNLHNFNYQKAITAGSRIKGFAEGGYMETSQQATQDSAEDTNNLLIILITEIKSLKALIESKSDLLKVWVSASDIEDTLNEINNIKTEVTMQ